MYSLTDRISFHVARELLDDLANLGSVVCPVLLLANKMDLCQHRKVGYSMLREFQKKKINKGPFIYYVSNEGE